MKANIKSGKEVLEEFIVNIKENEGLDAGIVGLVSDLHDQGKLTKTNLLNGLSSIREKNKNED